MKWIAIELLLFVVWFLSMLGAYDLYVGMLALGTYVFWKSIVDGYNWTQFAKRFPDLIDSHLRDRKG